MRINLAGRQHRQQVPVFVAVIGAAMPRARASLFATSQASSTAIAAAISAVAALAFPLRRAGGFALDPLGVQGDFYPLAKL